MKLASYINPLEDSMMSPPLSQALPVNTYHVRPKVIQDRVHDQMTFHPAIVQIIDTPQFQRLRELHQLGNCRHLFPGATHTRFEHSLGVAHLAMKMLKQIQANHVEEGPALDCTPQDILCVGIAGLCHDLGHGPLSHMFEHFVNACRKSRGELSTKGKWRHEDASVQMLEYLIVENRLDFAQFGLEKTDLTFVGQLIQGLEPKADWPFGNGRTASKRYLFDIVANKRNGIDVDKLDYFARDSLSCLGKLPELHVDRLFNCARVVNCDGEMQICFEEKVALTLGELFQLRVRLHKFVYQHRVVKVMDQMAHDALIAAEGAFKLTDTKGKSYSISQTVESMEVYTKTGDWILNALYASNDPALAESRNIIHKLKTRQLYRMVGHYGFEKPAKVKAEKAKDRTALPPLAPKASAATPPGIQLMMQESSCMLPPGEEVKLSDVGGKTLTFDGLVRPQEILRFLPPNSTVQEKDVFVTCTRIEVGSSGDTQTRDPISRVRFFNPKRDANVATRLSENRFSPLFTPQAYEEHVAFVCCKNEDDYSDIFFAFNLWFKQAKATFTTELKEPTPFVNSSPGPKGRKRDRDDSECPTTPPPMKL